jgi:hypothetical protein
MWRVTKHFIFFAISFLIQRFSFRSIKSINDKNTLSIFSIRFRITALILLGVGFFQCNHLPSTATPSPDDLVKEVVLDWHEMILNYERFTFGFKAPVAARAHAYMGLAGYMASKPFLEPGTTQPGLPWLKYEVPSDQFLAQHDLVTTLNACYYHLIRNIFFTAPATTEAAGLSLYNEWYARQASSLELEVLHRSQLLGESISREILLWAETDTIGHLAHLHNFDKNYLPPIGDSLWQPCIDFPTPALLPSWGNSRTFVIPPDSFTGRPLPPFSYDINSPYYTQALEVYHLNSPLSEENRWIAEFWSDDVEGLTYSSSGRWISIANQMIQKSDLDLASIFHLYLSLGIAISDATVACWKGKYHYNLLRPETLIQRMFLPNWRPILHTPPFPAYPAGHAMIAGAAWVVLSHFMGNDYAFTDYSHVNRKEFKSTPRSFERIRDIAYENAYSRIPLGVHFKMDCEEGLLQGENAARAILDSLETWGHIK